MADNTIKYKIIVDKESGTATIRDFRGQIVATQVPLKQLRSEFGNFAKEVNAQRFKQFNNSIKQTRANMAANTKATGAATAATMELGRVISDAPYGIRGMANNVSQLASNVFFMTKQVDEATGKVIGFSGALKNIGRSLMGSMGVLVAIQAIVAAFEFMANSTKKANKALTDIAESGVSESVVELTLLKKTLEDTSVSLEDKRRILGKAREEYEDLNTAIGGTPDEIKEAVKAIDVLIIKYQDFAKAKVLADLMTEAMKNQAKEAASMNNNWKDLFTSTENFFSGLGSLMSGAGLAGTTNAFRDSFKENEELIKKYEDMLNQPTKGNPNMTYMELLFGKKDGSGKKDKRAKVQTLDGLPTAEDIRDYYKGVFKALGDANTFERELEQLNVAKASGHITEEFFNEMKASLEEKYASENLLDGVAPKLELGENAKAAIDKYNKELLKVATDKMAAEDWAGYVDAFKQGLSLVSDFVDAQFERDLATEQNKTTAMNDELNQRLLNENLSKDERAKIQQEIWQNDDKLRKKQNEIKKKQFNANKAFQISMAVADTASSALKAYGSQLMIGNPASLIRAKIAAATATAIGLAQIATIASQKFVPESASTPIRTASAGGGGGGVGDRSFNFNLVGASQQNQLAQAIQGTFDKPIKAYVVSKDITNQQQLDANTRSTARFGG